MSFQDSPANSFVAFFVCQIDVHTEKTLDAVDIKDSDLHVLIAQQLIAESCFVLCLDFLDNHGYQCLDNFILDLIPVPTLGFLFKLSLNFSLYLTPKYLVSSLPSFFGKGLCKVPDQIFPNLRLKASDIIAACLSLAPSSQGRLSASGCVLYTSRRNGLISC